jgi:tRNA(Ile)-lysidine synthase
VSGGADSLALLVLARATGRPVTAVHIDHGLRPGSETEAAVVEAAAERFGAAFLGHRITVAPGPNLEERARLARHDLLPDGALTGHTADDQAETILINLLRGAGLDGLAGMRTGTGAAPSKLPSKLAHPLLSLRRSETHGLCEALGLEPVLDPTNGEPPHQRNRVRHEVLPLLAEVSRRDPVPILVRQAALLADDADLLTALAASLDPRDAPGLRAAPAPLARRALRRWLTEEDALGHPPDAATVERVMGVVRGEAAGCEVPGGDRVRRSRGRLRREPPGRGGPPMGS